MFIAGKDRTKYFTLNLCCLSVKISYVKIPVHKFFLIFFSLVTGLLAISFFAD